MIKPELLLPVGNVENFYAAIEGGADAVFLGLKDFNARGRAANFTNKQLAEIVQVAKERGVKIYVTLNIIIKNDELLTLLDTLNLLEKSGVAAVIIQDWGVYHLIKQYFPKLEVHASTQMANHNSVGVNHASKLGIARTILARELTYLELKAISERSKSEIEVFSHGALCYSFSGMCLFSSFLGGSGANRGLCAQPCRRGYKSGRDEKYVFSLKDNQLIDLIPQFAKMGVASIKIEGRLKSAEYVYRVAKAYRMMLDDHSKLDEAKQLLNLDFGREKTAYFMGGDVSKSISQTPNMGLFIGKVLKQHDGLLEFTSHYSLEEGNRVRMRSSKGDNRKAIKLRQLKTKGNDRYSVQLDKTDVVKGDLVFLMGLNQDKFPAKLQGGVRPIKAFLPQGKKIQMLKTVTKPKNLKLEELFVRIDKVAWLRKVWLDDIDGLIMRFPKRQWAELKTDAPFIQKNIDRFIIELPKFIPETELEFYRSLCKKMAKKGVRRFMISHLSQTELLPHNVQILAGENIYVANDVTASLLNKQGVEIFTYPQENDLDNLLSMRNKSGIVPVYFYPELFYSRMPVKLDRSEEVFLDDNNNEYKREVVDGITIVYPTIPVAITQHTSMLWQKGFRRIMLDFSGENISKNIYRKVFKRMRRSEQIQPSSSFNFRKGLK
ncbi:U32 family peptidase [Prolixibacteraceae bacterium JC049]|nr:U32 family peptidase [Prolixibacteraceae bacterium JC049]